MRASADVTKKLFWVSFATSLSGWICLFIAFSSPYWFQSWPRIFSPFQRTGLWEFCSNGLVAENDVKQVSYFGCWWIFAPYYHDIRGWIMPWWFIITQLVFSFAFLFESLKMIFEVIVFAKLHFDRNKDAGVVKGLSNFNIIIDIVFGILKSATVMLFGIAVYYDRNWMPEHELNYLSWSYGFAVISCFFSIFSIFPHVAFKRHALAEVNRETHIPMTEKVILGHQFPM